MYIRGQVKRSREKKGPVKRSRAVLGQSQAVKIDFRRSRILTPVANGPTASIGVTAPCTVLGQRRSRLLLCRAPVAPTHISTFGIYSSQGSRKNVRTDQQTYWQTDRPKNRQTDKPTDYNNPCARGLMNDRGI